MERDVIRRLLTGKSPEYIRGFLDGLKAVGEVDESELFAILEQATADAMRRIITGPIGDPDQA